MLDTYITAATVLAISAITPGPNTIALYGIGTRVGLRRAWPAIAGVVGGGLAVLAIALAGFHYLSDHASGVTRPLGLAGGIHLSALGVSMVRTSASTHDGGARASRAANALALATFQFVNPKCWMMVLSVVATLPVAVRSAGGLAMLIALFTLIPLACLASWALVGSLSATRFRAFCASRAFSATLGLALIACAVLLVLDTVLPRSGVA